MIKCTQQEELERKEVVEATSVSRDLWVHGESAIISADSHDIWNFTPDFLAGNEIVPIDWPCKLARRNQSSVDIRYDTVNWRMFEGNLWIDSFPDRPFGEHLFLEDEPLIPTMASRFLGTLPHLPVQKLWFFWRVSAVIPEPNQWMLNNFCPRGYPPKFRSAVVEPDLFLTKGDFVVHLKLRSQARYRADEPPLDAIMMECYVSRPPNLTVDEMIADTYRWSECFESLKQAIDFLLAGE